MSTPEILCIPNFSTTDKQILNVITAALKDSEVKLLHVDIGVGAGRTVMTFIGDLDIFEAAFKAVQVAVEQIDMRCHEGVHPCFGAVDVLPFVPFKNIGFQDLIKPVHDLSKRIAEELNYPIFCYEAAALQATRRNLAQVRRRGYTNLKSRFEKEVPDFGAAVFRARTGATAVGLRAVLVAYNIDLVTQDLRVAQEIAVYLREKRKAGDLAGVKVIAWHIPEYNFCQISTNVTRAAVFGLADVFETVKAAADKFGVEVSGSELIGLVPLKIMEDVAAYYGLENEADFISQAVAKLGLNNNHVFDPQKRIIELILQNR